MALKFLNLQRNRNGLSRLSLKPVQSVGTSSCVGSYGHSRAMAKSGAIWHVNAQFPKASFPNSICVHFMHAGENVGESASGNVTGDLLVLANLMMSEPHTKSDCASTVNHACNILNPAFRSRRHRRLLLRWRHLAHRGLHKLADRLLQKASPRSAEEVLTVERSDAFVPQ